MAAKLHFLVSNASEAEEVANIILAKLDKLRPLHLAWAHKAGTAERESQYRFYKCKFQQVDNQMVLLNRALTEVSVFLPMPANFPL
jgi:hypothetical protein